MYMQSKCCNPDGKVQEANVGPIWGRQDPGGTHVGPMNFAIWEVLQPVEKANGYCWH